MKKLIAIYEVLFWFFSGASIMYPEMTRWEIAKKIWKDNVIKIGDTVKRVNSDYVFIGTIVSIFQKTTGQTRYVVEDDRGVLFIWRRENFEVCNAPAKM